MHIQTFISIFISSICLSVEAFTPSFCARDRFNKQKHLTVLDSDDNIASFEPEQSNFRYESFSSNNDSCRLIDNYESCLYNNPMETLPVSRSTVESHHQTSVSQNEEYSVVIDIDSDMDLKDGTLSFPDGLLVQGSLIVGKLRCTRENIVSSKGAKVKVDSGAYLEATLYCVEQVEIWGAIRGNIHCETLLLGPDAVVEGNIETKFIQVMGGASINGSIKTGRHARSFDPRNQDRIIIDTNKTQNKELLPMTIIQEATKRRLEQPIIFTQTGSQRMSANEFYKPKKDSIDALFGTDLRKLSLKGDAITASGKYLDSFGNPLIVEADEQTVNSFRNVRRFSHETRTLLDAHLRQKEKDKLLRLSAMKNSQSSNIKSSKKVFIDDDSVST